MDVPSWWEFVLLALAAFRLTRLVGWDDVPPVAKARSFLLGERVRRGETVYKRQTLADLVECPFCLGFWISLAVWGAWQAWPHGTLVVSAVLAIASVVGLVAKNLDE